MDFRLTFVGRIKCRALSALISKRTRRRHFSPSSTAFAAAILLKLLNGIPWTAATSSPLDSRIPRPSPSALRRAVSLRVRGERAPSHYSRATTALVDHQHHYRRHNHLLQSSQQHQHPDHRTFPVITENGTDSPRQRSLVSTRFTVHCAFPRKIRCPEDPKKIINIATHYVHRLLTIGHAVDKFFFRVQFQIDTRLRSSTRHVRLLGVPASANFPVSREGMRNRRDANDNFIE